MRNFFRKWTRGGRYERKLAKQYADTIANRMLSPQERLAVEEWRRLRLEAWLEYERSVLDKPLF